MRYAKPHRANSALPVFIYCLWCPVARRIRYIGKTNQPDKRGYLHLVAAKRRYHDHHTSRWIRQLIEKGAEPRLRLLMRVPAGEKWQAHERRLIAAARAKGWPLTNQTLGGEGVEFVTEAQFESAKAARKAGMTDEVRARMSRSGKSAWSDPEIRARRIAGQRAAAATPERRAQLSRLRRTPEGEARRVAAVKAYWAERRATQRT